LKNQGKAWALPALPGMAPLVKQLTESHVKFSVSAKKIPLYVCIENSCWTYFDPFLHFALQNLTDWEQKLALID
jgi:hypothetical protein